MKNIDYYIYKHKGEPYGLEVRPQIVPLFEDMANRHRNIFENEAQEQIWRT
jgi:hypothetical protein